MLAKKRLISQEMAKLRKEELEIIGVDEAELRNSLNQAEKRVNADADISLEDYALFDTTLTTSLYSQLQKIVRERLIGEGKLNSTTDKDWNFSSSKTIENESKDNTLKFKVNYEKARIKREGKMNEITGNLNRIYTILNQFRGGGDIADQVKE